MLCHKSYSLSRIKFIEMYRIHSADSDPKYLGTQGDLGPSTPSGIRSGARFFNLTSTAAMVGGTQLFEGAHLTGAHTHFCRNSGKCRDYALFGVIPSNVPPERFRI